jgi:aminocarboxymuconate-semialdehyde decarboxylase
VSTTAPASIDMHTHVVPAGTPFLRRLADKDSRWAQLRRREDGSRSADVLVADQLFRKVRDVAYDLDAREAELARTGVSRQVLSAMPELFAVWAPELDAADYCRAFNDWLAEEVSARSGHFDGLGLVPLQDVEAATRMLTGVRDAGLIGVEIPSAVPMSPLHDSRFDAFFAEAARLQLLVFIHAVGQVSSFTSHMAGSSATFPTRIGEATASLIANGVLTRHPSLRLLISHGGGALPASLARLDYMRTVSAEMAEVLPRPASHYASTLFYDGLLFDAALLEVLVDIVGPGQVVLGSDYPFLHGEPNAILADRRLPAGLQTTIRAINPRRLIDLVSRPHTAVSASGGTS